MTMLFTDGFDASDFALKYETVTGGLTTSATRLGTGLAWTYTGNVGGGTVMLKKSFTASNKIIFGVAYKLVSNGDTTNLLSVYGDNGATQHLSIRFLATGQVVLARGATVIATSAATGLVALNTWAYYEMSATISDTVGTAEIRINGNPTPVLTFSGDTKNAGTANTIDAFSINFGGATSSTPSADDLYILNDLGTTNNTFLGDVRVQTLFPNGAGSSAQLSPMGSANNWENVEEIPYSAADYNFSGTAGQRDLYALSNPLVGSAAVYAVVPHIIARKTDTGLISAKTAIKAGSTVATGTAQAMATGSDVYATVHETNPDTGTAWAIGDLASLEAGVEVA